MHKQLHSAFYRLVDISVHIYMLINCESYVCIKKCQKEDKTVFLKKPKFHFLTFNSRWRSTASAVTHFQQRRG